MQYITTFGSHSLVGNEEIMRKLILDHAKEKNLEGISRAQGNQASTYQQRLAGERFADDTTRTRDFEARVSSLTARIYFLPKSEFLSIQKFIPSDALNHYYQDRHELLLSQMKRHQDLQVIQFNQQFKTCHGKEELEVVDRFPHTQQFFFDRKEKEEELERLRDSLNADPKTSLFEKI